MSTTIHGHDAADWLRDVPDNGNILTIVDARCESDVWLADLMSLERERLTAEDSIMSIDNSFHYSDYAVTLDSDKPTKFTPDTTVIGLEKPTMDERVDLSLSCGPVADSALFAVIAGLWLGYKTIYVAGVRLEPGTPAYNQDVFASWVLWSSIISPFVTIIGDTWLGDLINE